MPGTTRSSIYRRANGNLWLQALLLSCANLAKPIRPKIHRMNNRWNKEAVAVIKWMELKPASVPGSAWMARRDDEHYMRPHHAMLATAAKQSTARDRALKARALRDQGKSQKQIAAEIGITARGLRKLQKR